MSTISKTTIVAHRLSIHFQNIISPTKSPQKYLDDINHHIAVFREMLITLGQEKDCPELREKIRKWRCNLVEECEITAQILISLNTSNNRSCSTQKLENTNHYLILLFHLMHLFLRELNKSYRLIQIIPMDMKEYFENRASPPNLGNVISEILLLKKQIKPDFISEELSSISWDAHQIFLLLDDIQVFVPKDLNPNFDIRSSRHKRRKRKWFCCGSSCY